MPIKVNLGSGYLGLDEWINIDNSPLAKMQKWRLTWLFHRLLPERYNVKWPRNLLIRDLRRPLPFRDGTVDFIYCSHTLEHLTYYEASSLLKECFRVLHNNGRMRVLVPDLEMLSTRYLAKDQAYFNRIVPEGLNVTNSFVANFFHTPSFSRMTFRERTIWHFASRHKWMYDFDSLSELLKESGFSDVARMKFGEGLVPDCYKLDVFPELSLCVEAAK